MRAGFKQVRTSRRNPLGPCAARFSRRGIRCSLLPALFLVRVRAHAKVLLYFRPGKATSAGPLQIYKNIFRAAAAAAAPLPKDSIEQRSRLREVPKSPSVKRSSFLSTDPFVARFLLACFIFIYTGNASFVSLEAVA